MTIQHLQVDNRSMNILIDRQNPVFGWQVAAEEGERGIWQKSYRIRVWDEKGEEAWDSGRVESSRMCSIPYEGRRLRSSECFAWEVTCELECDRKIYSVKSGQAYFETGLLAREVCLSGRGRIMSTISTARSSPVGRRLLPGQGPG